MEALVVTEHAQAGASRRRVLAALILAIALSALDQTIVAAALPSVVRDLGGFSLFTWVFSGYILAQAVTIPLYGRFADLIGRKPVLLFGMGLFLIGSACCGVAWSMPALIGFRILQGLGAGAMQPVVYTLASDLYTIEERARVQGYLSGVWGIAALVGPTIGGLFTQYASWRWVFYVNIPVGVAAIIVIRRELHEPRRALKRHQIDAAGSALLAGGLGVLIFGLLRAGSSWGWASSASGATFVGAALLLAAFGWRESVAAQPILPLWVLRNRGVATACFAAVVVGSLMIGVAAFVPTYLQGVVGARPVVAAFTYAAMSIGWPVASSLSGHIYLRIGFRDTALIGMAAAIAAATALLLAPTTRTAAVFVPATLTMGFGIGLISVPMLIGAQSLAEHSSRGVVSGTVMFSRSLGQSLGAAVYGSIATSELRHRLAHAPTSIRLPRSIDAASRALLAHHEGLPPAALHLLQESLGASTRSVFAALIIVAGVGLLGLLASPRLPARRIDWKPQTERKDP